MTTSILSISDLSNNFISREDAGKAIREQLYNAGDPALRHALFQIADRLGLDLDRDRINQRRRAIWARHKASGAKRRAEKFGLTEHYTAAEWLRLVAFYGDRCVFCGSADHGLIADHVIPLRDGGQNTIENIQPICGRCDEHFIRSGVQRDHRRAVPDWFKVR